MSIADAEDCCLQYQYASLRPVILSNVFVVRVVVRGDGVWNAEDARQDASR